MSSLRILFIGSSGFGLKCLASLPLIKDIVCVGVITNPQTFSISYAKEGVTNVLHADVASYAQAHDIPAYTMHTSMHEPELLAYIQACAPDVILVIGWYHMVPKHILETWPTYGMHASLLPNYSGGAPLVWAMIHGEKHTGITLFQFANGVDNGLILGQKQTIIGDDDTIKTLYDRIEFLGIELLQTYLPRLHTGTATLTMQDESKRRIFPQRRPEDGAIDWSRPAAELYNFIRAQTHPYPGAFTQCGTNTIHIWKSQKVETFSNAPSGTLLFEHGSAYVVCGDGARLQLHEISINHEVYAIETLAQHHNQRLGNA